MGGRRLGPLACLLLAGLALAGPAMAAMTLEARTIVVPPAGLAQGFGGISGLDYDAARDRWYMISDDPARRGPSRFYSASIRLGARARVKLRRMRPLSDEAGRPFPPRGTGAEASDAESLRVDRATGHILWSSEGDFPDGFGPALRWMDRSGRALERVALPPIFALDPAGLRGPRANRTTEGLTLSPDGAVWLSMEAPFIEDGPLPDAAQGAVVRFTRLDPRGGPARQYAYAVDPVREAPAPPRRSDNGVSEILALDDHRLLVLERSGHETEADHFGFHNRLYLADLGAATDVASLASLKAGGFVPATKTLLLDFDSLTGPPVGCIEAMAWAPGPVRRLVLLTDNNFDADQPTEILVLSVGDLGP